MDVKNIKKEWNPSFSNYTEEVEEEQTFSCGVCDHISNSWEAYQEHVVSQEHIEKAARVFHFQIPTKKDTEKEQKNKQVHYCEVCDISCNGDVCWTAHLMGAKHKKKEKLKKYVVSENIIYGGKGATENVEPSTWQEFMKYPDPLIGLEFVVEIRYPGEDLPRFHCQICDVRFDNNLKFQHLTGIKHRFKIIKEKSNEWAEHIKAKYQKRSELKTRLYTAAKKLEKDEGRKKIKARIDSVLPAVTVKGEEKPGSCKLEPSPKKIKLESESKPIIKSEPLETPVDIDQLVTEKLREQMQQGLLDKEIKKFAFENLTELAERSVTNEEEADLAQQLSKKLTKALLKYRMKNMPESVLNEFDI